MESMPFYLSYAALWILVILHSLILLGVVRLVYQLQQTGATTGFSQDGRVSAGQEAPEFSAVDLAGAPISSADFAGRLTALLFVSPDCPACTDILDDDMAYLNHKAHGHLIVICRAEHEDCARLAEQHGLDVPVVADEDDQVSRLYEVAAVPTAVLINAGNRIQSYGQPDRKTLDEMFEAGPEAEMQEVS
jgi:peroxiredoxin